MQRQQVRLSANYMFNVIENQVADVSGLQYSWGGIVMARSGSELPN